MRNANILASSRREAVDRAKNIFANDEGVEFVLADGAATVGGATSFGPHTLVLHKAEQGGWATGETERQALMEKLRC